MSTLFFIAAAAAFIVGFLHSYLGEKLIVGPLLRRGDLPRIRGSAKFTAKVIRWAWHLTTVLFGVVGVVLLFLALDAATARNLSILLAVTFLPSGVASFIASRGRHPSWPPFLIIGGVCLYAVIAS